jgi:hypothetical protein
MISVQVLTLNYICDVTPRIYALRNCAGEAGRGQHWGLPGDWRPREHDMCPVWCVLSLFGRVLSQFGRDLGLCVRVPGQYGRDPGLCGRVLGLCGRDLAHCSLAGPPPASLSAPPPQLW